MSSFESPVNPLPPMVLILAAAIAVPELIFQATSGGLTGNPQGWRVWAIQTFAFYGQALGIQIESMDFFRVESTRVLTYPFVHGNITHAVFTAVFVLAIGKFIGEVFSNLAIAALFFICSIVAAVGAGLIIGNAFVALGAYPAAYGFIGAYTFLMWHGLSRQGENQWRAFGLIGFLLAFQLIFGLMFGADFSWVADVIGFVTGLLLSPLLAPGGLRAVLARIRR